MQEVGLESVVNRLPKQLVKRLTRSLEMRVQKWRFKQVQLVWSDFPTEPSADRPPQLLDQFRP